MGMRHGSLPRPSPVERPPPPDLDALEDPEKHPALRRYVRSVLVRLGAPEHELEDLVAEVVADAALARHRYDPAVATVTTWLESIARHRLIDLRRRWRAKGSRLVPEEEAAAQDEPESPDLNPEQAVHARRILDELADAVTGPPRQAFLLHAEGYTRPEIARRTGLQEGTVKHRLEQASELRDEAAARMNEDRRTGGDVRFGALPLLLAVEAHTVIPGSPAEHESTPPPESRGVRTGRPPPGLPWTSPTLPSKLAAAAALALVSSLAVPLGSGAFHGPPGASPLLAEALPARLDPSPPLATTAPPQQATTGGEPLPHPQAGARTAVPSSAGRRPSTPVAPPAAVPAPRGTSAGREEDSDVLFRLAEATARAGSKDAARSLLARHARQLPAESPRRRAALAHIAGARATSPR